TPDHSPPCPTPTGSCPLAQFPLVPLTSSASANVCPSGPEFRPKTTNSARLEVAFSVPNYPNPTKSTRTTFLPAKVPAEYVWSPVLHFAALQRTFSYCSSIPDHYQHRT